MERPEFPSHITEEFLLSKMPVPVRYWNVHGQQITFAGHTCLLTGGKLF